ncbi:MAG: MMPL family transporter [candidate division NC10 bacterium]|nr:MMPL family transporter [candidate division NC10 bacterium]
MKKEGTEVSRLTELSVRYPKAVILLTFLITIGFAIQFPKVRIDTDPKNMLPATSDVRVYNDQVEGWFGLHKDMMVLGIANEKGVLNQTTLERIARITEEILKLKGVVLRDVASFTTVDNVVVEGGALAVHPLMTQVPKTPEEMEALRSSLFENPLFLDRFISRDGTTTAIYIPLEEGANGKEIADRIQEILKREKGEEQYSLAGDPVARDTFGAEMFIQMGLFAPIAGMIMFIALFLMFRNLALAATMMVVAMLSTVWSMGALIGLGYPVHIMSSMIPVFLMAIATDSIHIFNEFYFRFKEVGEKRAAILDTIRVVGPPVRYTALATAIGFGVLALGGIIPVRVFGLFVAFGTLVIRLMSFSVLPAVMMLLKEERLMKLVGREDLERGASRWLGMIGKISLERSKTVVAIGLVLLTLALVGITKIRINNNMVNWFKRGSEIRQADAVMNQKLGGTSLAYLVASSEEEDAMKRPAVLRYLEALQRDLEKASFVGKTTSVVDVVKRINRVLHDDDPRFETIPDAQDVIGQYLFLFASSAKPRDLDTLVDYPFQKANIWVQLKTWDAVGMREVLDRIRVYTAAHPPPGVTFKPAGIAYFNLVWNDEVLRDMVRMFIIALILVFLVLAASFRSLRWGAISFIPLLFTILLIYGVVGFIGKDFDMPISVLSTLSLGMAVDFAIHFIRRFHQRLAVDSDVKEALLWTAARPGKGIMRNAVLFAIAFSVMVFASLTPYIVVGLFIVSLMLVSALLTIISLTALINLFHPFLLKKG